MPQGRLSVTKPISAWNKPLQADYGQLFRALSKMAAAGATLDASKFAIAAADAITEVGFEEDASQIAYILIRRALTRALFDLAAEKSNRFDTDRSGFGSLKDELLLALEEAELTVDASFFEYPRDLPIVEALRTPFEHWLIGVGLKEHQARDIATRLGSYFVFSLADEWRRKSEYYRILQEALETPFARAKETERAWLHHARWLERQIDEPMFDEAFSLRHVYVPLRAYWEEKERRVEVDPQLVGQPVVGHVILRHVVDLETALRQWIKASDPKDAVRVISGGPGSGKSSFTKMFAASMARDGYRVLFIPLHHFDARDDDLRAALVAYADRLPKLIPADPLHPKAEERLLLVFDGLDELAMLGKIAEEMAQRFIRRVYRTVRDFNQMGLRLQVVLSGRELTVQTSLDEIYKRHQVLHMLGYLVPIRSRFKDPEQLLATDQRDLWWQSYGEHGGGYSGIPEGLMKGELLEITAQPLLNYLLALSYARGKVDFSKETNLNVVYQDLLASVYSRDYEEGRQHVLIEGLSEKDFVRILEEIALATWHGDGRTTTVSEIEKHCGSGLMRVLESFQEGAEKGVTRLLTAFYFRQSGHREDGDKTFEFTHKSFSEYLAARRIVRTVQRMEKELGSREKDWDTGWDERMALKEWAEVCGPTTMERYLFSFLAAECRLRDAETNRGWQSMLADLIGFILRHGMPMEMLDLKPSYHEWDRQARNAEEALLATLSCCARVSRETSQINWPEPTSFGTWLRRLMKQRSGAGNTLAMGCLGRLSLSNVTLLASDLRAANLSKANLSKANLSKADLSKADLSGADLSGADLSGADLSGADLRAANLRAANLSKANLNGAHLIHAILRGADLTEADLSGADLTEANLSEADLSEANLSWAHLVTADLSGAILFAADVSEAELSGANLLTTNLSGANLLMADVIEANLRGADLSEADLSEADLRGADLSEVDLSGANLSGAKNLTQEQINSAKGNVNTPLPEGLTPPEHWTTPGGSGAA